MSPTPKYQDTKLLLKTAHFRDKLSLNSHFLLKTAYFRDKLSLNSHFVLEKAHFQDKPTEKHTLLPNKPNFRDKRVQYTMQIEQILSNSQPTDSQHINLHAFGILAERMNHKALYISTLRRTCIIEAGAD